VSSSSLLVPGLLFPSAAVLSLGASYLLVSRLERLAGRLRLSEAMLGLVVALAADSPEITSAVTASSHGQQGIGIGVVLGSNVFNLAALLGLGAVVAGRIHLHRRVALLEGATATWIAAMTAIVICAGWSAEIGMALVLLGVVPYVVVLTAPAERLRRLGLSRRAAVWLRMAVVEEEEELAQALQPRPGARLEVSVFAASLVVVVAASAVMERSAETLGKHFDVSSLVIGGVVLAAVTSLPNAVGAVFLAVRGRGSAVLSEAMNSNMLNVVIGLLLPGIFLGLGATSNSGTLVALWYGGLTVLSLAVVFAKRGLSRRDGLVIVAGYVAFVIVAVIQ
jgi:cation:H+ antiporter